jgi:RimJ/RimL family protein N-acetyltransferase
MAVPLQPATRPPSDREPACYIKPFEPGWASTVVGWVRNDRELLWLAPATPPPLTPDKVLQWLKSDRDAYLFWLDDHDQPIGYAELGIMPDQPDRMWLAHCIISHLHRGQGLGRRFLQLLVDLVIKRHGARELSLIVFPDNLGAICCYQQAGFATGGYEMRRFRPVGRRHRLLRMTIDLTR